MNPADISTKPTSGPTTTRHWQFLRGVRFHPPRLSPHMDYIESSTIASQTVSSAK